MLINAGPLDITWAKLDPGVTAILSCGYPAQSTGEALRRSLTMSEPQAAPAGRLQATWPLNLDQVPKITDYTMQGRTYRYYVGEPLYPFGFGLSYTSFSYTRLSISPSVITQGDNVTVEVCLKNTGSYDSDEVKSRERQGVYSYSNPLGGTSVHVMAPNSIPPSKMDTRCFCSSFHLCWSDNLCEVGHSG